MCSRDEQRAVPRGERPVVRIRRRTKRGVCARVSSFPELEAAGCRVMRSLYPCGARTKVAGQPPHCCHCHRVSRANTVRCGGRQQFFIRRTLHPAAVLQACARRRGPTRPAGKVARVRQAAVAVGRISFFVCLQGRTGRAVSQSRRGTSVPPDRGQVTRTCPWRPVCSRGTCCSSSHCLSCFPG